MDSRKTLAIAAILLASAGAASASAGVVYSNFLAGNGVDPTASIPMSTDGSYVEVSFEVPPGLSYLLTGIDVALSNPNGVADSLSVALIRDPPWAPGDGFPIFGDRQDYSATIPLGGLEPTQPQIVFINTGGQNVLDPSLYHLRLSVGSSSAAGATVNWHQNSAGVNGTTVTSFVPQGTIEGTPIQLSTGPLPAFRIRGIPQVLYQIGDSPPIAPAFSSFATVAGGPAAYATVELEVICPGPKAQFTCPVGVSLQAGETPAQVCGDVAAAINNFADTAPLGSCWPLPNLVVDPSQFHADCSGDSVRITNSTAGLCQGAFVCVDGLNNLTKFAALPQRRTLAYEYDSVSGPLVLDFSGTFSGIPGDPTHPGGIQVIHRRLLTDQTFAVNVQLPAGSTPSQIGSALAAAMLGDADQVSATPTGLRFNAGEPYDLTLRVNDSALSWALSPFTDLLARSSLSTNPAPFVQPTCAGGPTRLCLQHGRFQVEAAWSTSEGGSGDGLTVNTTDESGSFTFFDAANVEIVAKIVNACDSFHKWWFFAAGATNVGVDLKVTDTLTGQVRTYHNATGAPFQPILDTDAFGSCPVS
jgi:hypothetical protein